MSSKKAKAKRKEEAQRVVVPTEFDNFGIDLPGLKFLGKQVTVAFGLYDSEKISDTFNKNSEEFEFIPLEELPVLWGSLEEVEEQKLQAVNNSGAAGLSVGVIVITDKTHLFKDEQGNVHLDGETLPFLVGEQRGWRNPKYGHIMIEDDEVIIEQDRLAASFYAELFPSFDAVYKVEQLLTPSGFSDSLDKLVDKSVKALFIKS